MVHEAQGGSIKGWRRDDKLVRRGDLRLQHYEHCFQTVRYVHSAKNPPARHLQYNNTWLWLVSNRRWKVSFGSIHILYHCDLNSPTVLQLVLKFVYHYHRNPPGNIRPPSRDWVYSTQSVQSASSTWDDTAYRYAWVSFQAWFLLVDVSSIAIKSFRMIS